MLTLIKNFDFLGETINFSINKHYSFKSVIGGLLTLSILLSYIFFFYLFGRDFILKKNPNSYSEIRLSKNSMDFPILQLNETKFLFGISAFNPITLKNIDISEIFFPDLIFLNYSFSNKNESAKMVTPINLIPCNLLDTTNILTDPFTLADFLCPNMSELNTKSITGDSIQKNYSYTSFSLNLCPYSNNKSNCDLSNILKEFENGGIVIEILTPQINYDTDNYENPFLITLNYYESYLDLQMNLIDDSYLMKHLLEDDIGILYENKIETIRFGTYSTKTRFSLRNHRLSKDNFNITDLDTPIYTFNLFFSKNTYYFTRKYMKFQELIANVKGFIEMILFITGFFYKFYSRFRLDTYLFNRLILIKDENFINNNFSLELNEKNLKNKINVNLINVISTQKDKFTHFIESEKKDDKFNSLEKSNNENLTKIDYSNDLNSNKSKIKKDNNKNFGDDFNIIFTKLTEYKNNISFKFFGFIKYFFLGKKTTQEELCKFKYLSDFKKKIYFKFDIFYYLKMIKKNKLLIKSILTNDQNLFLKVLSKKSYNLESIIKLDNMKEKIIDIKKKVMSYYDSEDVYEGEFFKNVDSNIKNVFFP